MFPVPRSHLSIGLQILKGCCRHQHTLWGPIQEIPGNRMARRLLGQDWRGKNYLGNLAECMLLRLLSVLCHSGLLRWKQGHYHFSKNNKLPYRESSTVRLYFLPYSRQCASRQPGKRHKLYAVFLKLILCTHSLVCDLTSLPLSLGNANVCRHLWQKPCYKSRGKWQLGAPLPSRPYDIVDGMTALESDCQGQNPRVTAESLHLSWSQFHSCEMEIIRALTTESYCWKQRRKRHVKYKYVFDIYKGLNKR